MALKLPRLPNGMRIADRNGAPGLAFTQYWQRHCQAIEEADAIQAQALLDIQTALTNAGIALTTARARMPALAPITITANSSGTVDTGQLPRAAQFRRYELTTDVTTTSTWSATLLTGSATFSIGAATGILTITALAASSTIEVTSVRDGVTLTAVLVVNKVNAPAGGASGGGTSASDSSFASFNSASHAPVSDELTVTAGSGGTVTLTAANLVVSTAAAAPAGSFPVLGKWEWDSTGGGVWVDVGTEDANTIDCSVDDLGGGSFLMSEGSLTSNEVKSGLVALSSHKFRFSARNNAGTRTMYLAGTVNAAGS